MTRARPLLARFAADRRGVSAIEFALVALPMFWLFVGSVELCDAISVKRKVTLTASSVADLISRDQNVDETDARNILDRAAPRIMTPYPSGALQIVVSRVDVDDEDGPEVVCSATLNDTEHPVGGPFDLPDEYNTPGTSVIVAEATYQYRPIFGRFLGDEDGIIPLSDTFYFTLRNQNSTCTM